MDDTKRQAIADAAAKLDKDTDAHWTKAGLPDCNALSELAGVKVTRAECTEALGEDFTRFPPLETGDQSTDQTEGGDDAQAEQAEGAQTGDEAQGPEAPDTPVAEVPEAANAEDRPRGGGMKMGWVA